MSLGRKVVYTGPVDRYFDYTHGHLNWRSVRFEIDRLGLDDYQGTSVMNYAETDVPFTRIHEPKHLHLERPWKRKDTVIIREFSQVNPDEPYYPVNFESDKDMFSKYEALMKSEEHVIFGGRLARYEYLRYAPDHRQRAGRGEQGRDPIVVSRRRPLAVCQPVPRGRPKSGAGKPPGAPGAVERDREESSRRLPPTGPDP